MDQETAIWFPNYGNNPGIVSKLLQAEISTILENYELSISGGYYKDFEKFILSYEINDETYLPYISSSLQSIYGGYYQLGDLEIDQILKGRLRHPGKVGFGMFVDIGLWHKGQKVEALLPLYQMKNQLKVAISCRKMIKIFGFVDALPLEVQITNIDASSSEPQISVRFSESQLDQLKTWIKDRRERLFVTKTFRFRVESAIEQARITQFIDGVVPIDPLTTVVICDNGTNASGIIGKLGNNLPGSPIGILSPQRVEEFQGKNR